MALTWGCCPQRRWHCWKEGILPQYPIENTSAFDRFIPLAAKSIIRPHKVTRESVECHSHGDVDFNEQTTRGLDPLTCSEIGWYTRHRTSSRVRCQHSWSIEIERRSKNAKIFCVRPCGLGMPFLLFLDRGDERTGVDQRACHELMIEPHRACTSHHVTPSADVHILLNMVRQ